MEIKSGELNNKYFHTSNKSYRRQAISLYVDSFNVSAIPLSNRDYFNLDYMQNENFECTNSESTRSKRSVLNDFYKHKSALYDVGVKDFNLIINPVLYYRFSSAKYNDRNALINNRGIEIRGNIGNKIGFYTQVSDEVLQPLPYINELINRDNAIPGVGFYKTHPNYYDYFLSSGYVTYSMNPYMDWQFGHGRNYIGDGFRSFILSNNTTDNLFLKLSTRIWKINYTNIFSEYRTQAMGGYVSQRRHYSAMHHLSVNVGRNLNIGVFETIIFQRDSGSTTSGFEMNYLNPLIFYKSVENGLNSTDKAVLGMNFKYNFLKHFSLYGQAVISEFVMNEMLSDKGWWGNKWATQLGLKYIDVAGVKNLDVQGEVNICRPYMYTSFSALQSYTHFNQPLAHPLGANFKEMIGIAKYQPAERVFLEAKGIIYWIGNDTAGSNWGRNIGLGYNSRPQDYNTAIAQGVKARVLYCDISVSYMIKHNLFIDVGSTYRKSVSVLPEFESDNFWMNIGIRLNIANRNWDY